MKKLYYVSMVIFFGIFIFGLAVIGNVVHEFSHYFDIKKYPEAKVTEMCFLNYPFHSDVDFIQEPIAYVRYESPDDVQSSEARALTLGIIVLIMGLIVAYYFVNQTLEIKNGKT